MKIQTGDKIIVLSGKYKGVKSDVEKAYPKDNKVLVKDVNVVTKHIKQQEGQGGRVKMAMPVSVSKVQLICPNCGKRSRVGYKFEGSKKVRYCKKCEETI